MDEKRKRHTCGECHNVMIDKYLAKRVICREGYGFRRFTDKACHAFKGEAEVGECEPKEICQESD